MGIFRTKSIRDLIAETQGENQLKKVLGARDLISLGIGAIIGTGIFVITGVAASQYAGPAIIVSFILSAVTCALAALAYAEFASMIPVAGSAYTYSYAALGEIFAWIIGWDLILEYSVAISAIAIGWSGYMTNLLKVVGINLPTALTTSFLAKEGGFIDLPAVIVIAIISYLLIKGIKESIWVNNVIVVVKLAVIILFILLAFPSVNAANWQPFMPFGFKGVVAGAAIVFFAYIGFDAVSTAAEEVKRPQRDLPIGITVSLLVATVLYIAVAAVLTGVVKYTELSNQSAPVAYALTRIGQNWAAGLLSLGAIAGITSVLLVMMLGQTRIFFAMSRDGLLPRVFGEVSTKTKTPVKSTLLTLMLTGVTAAFLPINVVAELTNIGTLAAFIIVSIGVIVLRVKKPEEPRPFRCPGVPLIPLLSVALCTYLIISLDPLTWLRFFVWLIIGVIVYFIYSKNHSKLQQDKSG
ncbi:MAG: amino acid permease [Clostridia bacterium]|nr:amino acid permease [Clostridia bacterium]